MPRSGSKIDIWNYETLKMRLEKKAKRSPANSSRTDACRMDMAQKSITTYCKRLTPCSDEGSCSGKSSVTIVQEVSRVDCLQQTKLTAFFKQNSSVNAKEKPTCITEKSQIQPTSASVAKKHYPCPRYKFVQGTSCVVDAFRYGTIPGVDYYFLSHFHFDHYSGLRKSFSKPLYCSKITANLIILKLKVSNKYIHALDLDQWHCLPDSTSVMLIEANHCPGAVMFLFKTKDGHLVLHTGDFRAEKLIIENPLWQQYNIDVLYLDTTYCNPAYSFPPQHEVIEETIEYVRSLMVDDAKVLLVVGAYMIGKERIFTAIAEEFDCMICVEKKKMDVLKCLEDRKLERRLTLFKSQTFLHVVDIRTVTKQNIVAYALDYTHYDHVVGILPSGWEFNRRRAKDGFIRLDRVSKSITIIGVPYSEHSSYSELRQFVQTLRPKDIIPTVNVASRNNRNFMKQCFADWLSNAQISY